MPGATTALTFFSIFRWVFFPPTADYMLIISETCDLHAPLKPERKEGIQSGLGSLPWLAPLRYLLAEPHRFKRKLGLWWTTKYLHRNHISILIIIACQNKAFNIGWEEASEPLTACWDGVLGWNDHQHIIVSPNNTHHAYSAPFFDIPGCKHILEVL